MEPTIQKPIERSRALIPLSKDHHDGLLLCWKIRMGLKNEVTVERIAAYIINFYNIYLNEHFRQEEEYLFTLLTDTDELKAKAIEQHKTIRDKIDALPELSTQQSLERIANELEDHIRFEERILFGHIEKNADPQILTHLGDKLIELSKKHCEHTWQDEFWVYKK
ncbi:MAG: hemerythrin domain-containing protein [Bacteroidetes bacterium]|nr:hemerythrin domain-containing protein [Bacteroidota bacterium]